MPGLTSRRQRSLIRRAMECAHRESAVGTLGLTYIPIGLPQITTTGVGVVLVQQLHHGVPVHDAVRSVQLSGRSLDDALLTGEPTTVASDVGGIPDVGARAAGYAAARHVADVLAPGRVDASNRRPRLVTQFSDPQRSTVLHKRPFRDPISARLVVLPEQGALAWEVRLDLPRPGGAYLVHVEATGRRTRNPRVLGARRLGTHAVARGAVHQWNPDDGIVDAEFPRSRSGYPPFDGTPLPDGPWIRGDATVGNNVRAETEDGESVTAVPDANGVLRFPAGGTTLERSVVNAFYWCNVAHDFFHLLGFDEEMRNFQERNHSGLGVGGDPVWVTAWSFELDGVAEFVNRLDGAEPELNLGTLGDRHSGLDTDVVLHEYVHGVINRTVGNGAVEEPLTRDQSRALGEGYCDFFTLSLQDFLHAPAGPERIFGAWIRNNGTGLRQSAYGPGFTATYGTLSDPGYDSHHDAGQVWCATLLDIRDAIVASLGSPDGEELTWQLGFDSLKALHGGSEGPTWIHARDALLRQLERVLGGEPSTDPVGQAVLQAFGARGLGPAATCPDASYQGIQEDVT